MKGPIKNGGMGNQYYDFLRITFESISAAFRFQIDEGEKKKPKRFFVVGLRSGTVERSEGEQTNQRLVNPFSLFSPPTG